MKLHEFLNESNWCRFSYAKKPEVSKFETKTGPVTRPCLRPCNASDKEATKFCLIGAMQRIMPSTSHKMVTLRILSALATKYEGIPKSAVRGQVCERPLISVWQDQAEWAEVHEILLAADV